jgi:VWFA-related protein
MRAFSEISNLRFWSSPRARAPRTALSRKNFSHAAKSLLTALLIASLLAPPMAAQAPQRPPQQTDPRTAPPPPPPPRQQQEAVIRAFTDLVLVDAQVTDRAGRPIKGLKPENFTVTEDDKQQQISSFDYYDIETIETAGAEDQRPVVVHLGAVAAPDKVREMVKDRRMIVLFFDLTSMQPEELFRATDAGLKFLTEQMTAADLVAIVAFGTRLSVLANFTNDRDLLARAVRRMQPGKESQLAGGVEAAIPGEEAVTEDTGAAFTADETEFNIFNTDRKLAALQGIAELLRDIPGKKSVIHFGGGISQTGAENRSQLRAATDAANRANVSFYAVDSRGLQAAVPGGDASTGAQSGTAMFRGASVFRQIETRQGSVETLSTLAADTGGRAFYDTGDFREVFQKVHEDASGYYLLGYYSSNNQRDGRWRRIRVRVNVPGARLRFREGYYAPKTFGQFTAEDRERQLDDAMRAEMPRVELPLALELAQFRIGPNEIFVPIAAKIASSALEWAERRGRREAQFDFAAEVREENSGRPVAALRDTVRVRLEAERFRDVQQRAILYQGGVILGPGDYRVKFLARENESGRIGTFEQDFHIPRMDPAGLQLSTVLLSSQIEPVRRTSEVERRALGPDAKLERTPLEAGGERIIPSVTRVFTTEQRLYIFFQAYAPEGTSLERLRAGLVFFRGGERVSETPLVVPAELDTKSRTAAFRISLPLEKLATGRYTVQAIVIEAGREQAAFSWNHFALRTPPARPPAASPPADGAAFLLE